MNVCKVGRFVKGQRNLKNRHGVLMSFPTAALSRSSARTVIATAAVVVLLTACGQSQPPGGGMHGMPPAQVVVASTEPMSIPVVFEYVGQTVGSKEVEVRARVSGILERKLFDEGGSVKAGQPLFVIDPKPLQ